VAAAVAAAGAAVEVAGKVEMRILI